MNNKKIKFVAVPVAMAVLVTSAYAVYIALTNQNFNDGTLNGWSANSTSISASSDRSNDGAFSCKFKDPTSAFSGRILTGDLINLVTATGSASPSDDYAFTLSAWFYVSEEAGDIDDTDMQLYVKWFDSGGNDLGKDTGLIAGETLSSFDSWQQITSDSMAAPANAVSAVIYLTVKESVNNNNDVYVDTVRFSYDPLPTYLKAIGLKTFGPSSDVPLKVFFPYSTPAGKPSSCRIVFNLPATPVTEQRVNVLVYDVKGRLVRAIVKGEEFQSQHYDYIWDGRDVNQQFLPCGMYIISVELADQDTGGVVKEQTVVAIGRKL